MSLHEFYGSYYQQPLLLALPSFAFLAWLGYAAWAANHRGDLPEDVAPRLSHHGWLWRYLVVFTAASILDAFLTAPSGPGGTALTVFFVWLGDYKAFAFLTRERRKSRPWLRALAWSAIVPILSGVAEHYGVGGRRIFLTYELFFLATWTIFVAVERLPSRLTGFTYAYYSMWALADIWLLARGEDLTTPWALRIVANVMYYAAWTPWVYSVARPSNASRTT